MDELPLTDFFKTKTEAIEFLAKLGVISERIFETGFNLDTVLGENLGMTKKDKFMKYLTDSGVNTGSNTQLSDFLRAMEQKISALPGVTVTLAVDPDAEMMQVLADWCVNNIKSQVVLTIQVDPEIIGGAKVAYNGKFADYSVRPVFDKWVLKITSGQNGQPV